MGMGLQTRSTLFALASLILAGCAGSGATTDTDNTSALAVDPGGETGAIDGTVVDDGVNPIPGALVAVTTTAGDLQATTDVAGRFVLNNVPPGKQTLFAAALGYDSVAKVVQVVGGEVTSISLSLSPIPIVEPYVETFGPFDGYFECRMGHANTGECGWLIAQQPHPTQVYPNDRSIFRFNVSSEEWQTFHGEMRWQQGSFATSTAMRLAFSYEGRSGSHRWCSAEGASPLSWRYERTESDLTKCAADGADNSEAPEPGMQYNPLRTYANVPFGGNLDPEGLVYLSFQQRFQVLVTVFYGEPGPADYTGFPDA